MRSIHLRVLVALCLCVPLIELVYCSKQSFVQPSNHRPFIRKHFLKRRIPYNSNCTASFQLELLHCGDVHPNPGPDMQNGDTLPSSVTHRVPHHVQREIKYTPAELLRWRHSKNQLPRDICDIIQACGITRRKTRRGTRGGRRRNNIKCKRQLNSSSNLQLCSVNVRSVRNKTALVHDFICDSNADLIAMTETWLTDSDSAVLHELIPAGYRFVHQPSRSGRRGGGTGLVYRETINVRQVAAGEKDSFEFAEYLISCKKFNLKLVNIYRPPFSESHPVTVPSFISEFNDFIQCYLLSNTPILIIGYFNIHVDADNADSRSFLDLTESLCCTQLVNFGTDIHGHILDLMICRQSDDIVIGPPWPHGSLISDHIPIMCLLNSLKPPLPSKTISFRKPLSAIDVDTLKLAIAESELCKHTPSNLTELALLYDVTLSDVLEQHAPVKTKKVFLRPQVPWYTDSIRAEKRKKRRAEKRWLRTKTDRDWNDYKSVRNSTLHLLNEVRRNHHRDVVMENKDDQNKLFNVIKLLLNLSNKQPLISCNTEKQKFVNELGNYFHDKVLEIHTNIETKLDAMNNPRIDSLHVRSHDVAIFSNFKPLSKHEVEKLILKLSKKSCSLDPMPTKVLLQCIDELIPVITSLINLSLSTGHFPTQWKVAHVQPLLKKPGLAPEYFNLRPVSNLKYISKLVEGAATQQILNRLNCNSLLPPNQSAYRQFHSTETTLLRIKSDLLMAMDNQKVTILLSLDLSSAFDTIDHFCLLETLQICFGIDGVVLRWIESYLADRHQKIKIDDVVSDEFPVPYGVPQGSWLGPLLFTLYTGNLIANVQAKFPEIISSHCYADDTQLYLSFRPDVLAREQSISTLEACVDYIRGWMLQNKLMLSDNKTEMLIIGTSKQLSKLNVNGVVVGDSVVKPSIYARNLGVHFDAQLNMEEHITNLCKSAYHMIYNLRHLRKYLDQDSMKAIVHACITSKLDYCNGLLYGLPESQIGRLQRVKTLVRG